MLISALTYIMLTVIRFTREEILALRKASKVLSSMTEFPDIISVTALGPETLRPLEQDEVSEDIYVLLYVVLHSTDNGTCSIIA